MNPTGKLAVLKKYWNYSSFRQLQEEIIDSTLAGHDTLGLMPTGGGKSLTFQVPGMMTDGITLVISPLVSLMKDQVENLRRHNIKAVCLHAAMSSAEIRKAWEIIVNGSCRFLYFSPERIANDRFCEELRHLNIIRIVVDEAHCISQWGYDFRPAYLNIKKLRKYCPGIPFLALTATATPQVADDICHQLEFHNHAVFRKSFMRPEISYIVRPVESKLHETAHILNHTSGSAIVFVRSRKKTLEISSFLQEQGFTATRYHAGLSPESKNEAQNGWLTGKYRVIVATNAFGMGIDKANVRVVIHADIPPSPEEYYQEAGRAGRDGNTSYAVLLTTPRDKATLRRRVTEAFPPREFIRKTYERICIFFNMDIGEGYLAIREFDMERFCSAFSLRPADCLAAIRLLSASGYIDYIEETDSLSRLLITASRQDLYAIKTLSPVSENVLTTCMRLYPGLFSDFVYINENRIAHETKLDREQVYDALITLSKMKICSYVPKKRVPYIFFPTAREETGYVKIPKTAYEERREILRKRVEAVIDYAFSENGCRVKRMLKYFGEDIDSDCLKCDICRRKSGNRKSSQIPDIAYRIMQLAKNSPAGISWQQIESRWPGKSDDAYKAVCKLCSEGFLSLHDGLYRIT